MRVRATIVLASLAVETSGHAQNDSREALGTVQLGIDARRRIAGAHRERQYVDLFLDAGFERRFVEVAGILGQTPMGQDTPWAVQAWALGGVVSPIIEEGQDLGEAPRDPVGAAGMGLHRRGLGLIWFGAVGLEQDGETHTLPVLSGAEDLVGLFAQLGLDLRSPVRSTTLLGWRHDYAILDRGVTVLTRPRVAYERFEVADERRVDRLLASDPMFVQLAPGPGFAIFAVPLLIAVPVGAPGAGGKIGLSVVVPLSDENVGTLGDVGDYQDQFMRLGGWVSVADSTQGGAVGGGGELAWGNVDAPAFLISAGVVEPEFASRYPEVARSLVLRVHATLTF